MGSAKRPAINAPMTVCTRTLADNQKDAAAQAATRETCTITSPASKIMIASWAAALELEILIAFNIDPERYTLHLHELTPPDQPCPEAKEVRSLNYLDLSDVKPTVTGALEVHFVPKDSKIPSPTFEEIRAWQKRWAVIAADPAPPPEKTTVTFCALKKRAPMRVDIASLSRPAACDVHGAMRSRLGLVSERNLFRENFSKVFGVDLGEDNEVSFHFAEEACDERRDVDGLRTLAPDDVAKPVKVHVRSAEAEAEAEAESVAVAKVAKRKRKKSKGKKRSREE
jgi:hypothetical protein